MSEFVDADGVLWVNYLDREYKVDPKLLEAVSGTLAARLQGGASFTEACAQAAVLISPRIETTELENIPQSGPLIVVKNHPCHFDFTCLYELFRKRPDLKMPIKSSPLVDQIPTDRFIVLHKEGPHADREDIAKFQEHLKSGGSILVTPWGGLDFMVSPRYANMYRTTENVHTYIKYIEAASTGSTTVVPVYLEVEWGEQTLPLKSMSVSFQKPIQHEEPWSFSAGINTQIPQMYSRFIDPKP